MAPGIYIRIARDAGTREWEDPVEIMIPQNRSPFMHHPPEHPDFYERYSFWCNVNIIPIAEDKMLLMYSDFYYTDQNGSGKTRKAILSHVIKICRNQTADRTPCPK